MPSLLNFQSSSISPKLALPFRASNYKFFIYYSFPHCTFPVSPILVSLCNSRSSVCCGAPMSSSTSYRFLRSFVAVALSSYGPVTPAGLCSANNHVRHTQTYTHQHTHPQTHAHTCTNTNSYMHAQTLVRAHTHTQSETITHAHYNTHTPRQMHTHTYTQTRARAHPHTHTLTHPHQQVRLRTCSVEKLYIFLAKRLENIMLKTVKRKTSERKNNRLYAKTLVRELGDVLWIGGVEMLG